MKKRTALLVAAALVVTSLSGCSGKSGQKKLETPAAKSTTTAIEQKEQTSKTADPMAAITDDGTEKTITYWHTFTEGARKDYIDEMVAEYMKEHPNVKINVEVYPWNVFAQKWTAGLAAGALPDVSSVNPDNLFAINQAGAVLPMNPLIDALEEDYFLGKPLDNFTDGDTVLGIPYYLHSYVMWYRKDVLEEKNLSVPKNWDELLSTVAAVADIEIDMDLPLPCRKTIRCVHNFLVVLQRRKAFL